MPGSVLSTSVLSTSSAAPHVVEQHFNSCSQLVRDIIIGMSDGLTVSFAQTVLSGSTAASSVDVVTAGLVEAAAEVTTIGLDRYLAAKTYRDHYNRKEKRERHEIVTVPDKGLCAADEVAEILAKFGLQPPEYSSVVEALRKRPDNWLEFMMRFKLGLERPDPTVRAVKSAATIALSNVVGGLIPLIPYMALPQVREALLVSVGVTLLALVVFGYVKGCFTGTQPLKSAIQTVVVGALAATAAFGLARAIQPPQASKPMY